MTVVSSGLSPEQLQQAARDHLWLHFTRMGGYRDAEVPIIVRGDGCYLEDANGKRYLDALAGLFWSPGARSATVSASSIARGWAYDQFV